MYFDCIVISTTFLPFYCVIGHAVMVERAKHLNSQNSIEQEEKQQKDGHTPNLLTRPPMERERERENGNFSKAGELTKEKG